MKCHSSSVHRKNPGGLLLAALGFCLAAMAAGAEPTATVDAAPNGAALASGQTSPESAETPAFLGGLWVFVDPATGVLRPQPTPEQAAWRRSQATPNPLLNKSSAGLVPFALEDGGRGVSLKGRFRHSLSVTLNPDGTFTTHCSDHPDAGAGHTHAHDETHAHGDVAHRAAEGPAVDEAPLQ
ncbi:MAG: hypothetical protein AAGM22_18460 [Acidobacteriota bacterium]